VTDFDRIVLMGKLRKAKRLADSARWELLDVVIFLNAVETELTASQNVREQRSGELGEGEHYADAAEEYRPGGDEP
jgi:hypothetical protein